MRVRVKYKKGDTVRFLSHLDVARNMRMALKRAKWPVAITRGYSPKMRVSFYSPLPVGTSGEEEYLDVTLDKNGITDFIQAKAKGVGHLLSNSDILAQLAGALSNALPKGFAVCELVVVHNGQKPFESQIQGSLYRTEIEEVTADTLSSSIEAFLAEKQVLFEVQRPKESRTMDLRDFVESISLIPGSSPATLFMTIRHDNGRTVRPQWVIDSLSRFGMDINTGEVIVDRLKLYFG